MYEEVQGGSMRRILKKSMRRQKKFLKKVKEKIEKEKLKVIYRLKRFKIGSGDHQISS